MYKIIWTGLIALFLVGHAYAGEVRVSDVWTRATAPGQDSAMVQLVITSKQDAKLIAASSKVAKTAELHSMLHENGMMKMRQIEELELPAGKAVDFAEEGCHLMLLDLKQPLKEGTKIEVVLTVRFADGKKKKVKALAIVKPLTESVDYEHGHHH